MGLQWSAWVDAVTWLLQVSVQGAVLVAAILVIRRVTGQRLSAQWRHALWLLLLLRLLLPWTPHSQFSLYAVVPNPFEVLRTESPAPVARSQLPPSAMTSEETVVHGATQASGGTTRAGLGTAIVIAWLLGAGLLGCWLLAQAISLAAALRGRRAVTDEAVLVVLEDCREILGIRAYLAVVETPHVRTPALFGWIRPRLLLPEGLLAKLDARELQHVFLHELSHLKRHDIAFTWLMALAQMLHWFNPAVWVASHQARLDMELACDELALSYLEDRKYRDYGLTIVKLLDSSSDERRLPMLAGIGENFGQVKRRIQMITRFHQRRLGSPGLAIALLLVLGVSSLVDAEVTTAPPTSSPASTYSAPNAAPSKKVVASPEADRSVPEGDAAMEAAERMMALLDAGDYTAAWDEMHPYARTLFSAEAFGRMCGEWLRLETNEHGKVLSRKPVSVELIPNLPKNLGDGISVLFLSTYEKGKFPGPKLLFAKDDEGDWRCVRIDPK